MTPAETLSALVQTAAPDELPALAAELARASALVMTRIVIVASTPIAPAPAQAPAATQDLLTIEEAAKFLNVPVTWLYRHWRVLGLGRKLGRRILRFDRRVLERWAASRPQR